jgi:RNA polymerase sigma-70 factor (ECF subfamily)
MMTEEDPAHARVAVHDVADEDAPLLLGLRQRDEQAFVALIERYHARLVRLASLFVPNQAVAEEVVQETWIGVLQGIDRFEEHSSFRTWLFRILTNQAKRRGQREARSLPFAAVSPGEAADGEGSWCAVGPERFLPADHEWAGHWVSYPQDWQETPEAVLLAQETQAIIQQAIAALPLQQRRVITLRDIEGFPAAEVCGALAISQTHQRVLLHRARSKVRARLDDHLEGHP